MRTTVGSPMAPARIELARLLQRLEVARLLGDPEHDPRIARRRRHAATVGHCVRDGLLDRHVLAAGDRGQDVLGVQGCGAEDLDRVDHVVGQQLGERCVPPVDAPLVAAPVRARRGAGRTAR